MRLSPHFTLDELTFSEYAERNNVNNEPSDTTIERLLVTASKLEQVRSVLNDRSIHVSSGYRSPTLNLAIGGSKSSAHTVGYAVDFTSPNFGTPYQICKAIMASPIKFDQLIWEFGRWVHISFDPKARGEILTASKVNRKTVYTKGIA